MGQRLQDVKKHISSPYYGNLSFPVNLRLVFNSLLHLQEAGCGGMDWTDLADDRDRWREFVNAVMN